MISNESKFLISIAEEIVSNRDSKDFSYIDRDNINWVAVKNYLSYHGLAPLAYVVLRKYFSLFPKELTSTLEATYGHYLIYVARAEKSFLNLCETFQDRGITLIPIKGMALLEDIYVKYPVRSISDIDVLVKEEEVDKASKILEEQGFKKNLEDLKEEYWRQKQYHLVFIKKESDNSNLIVELHWNIDYPRKGRQLLTKMFYRLRDSLIQNKNVKLLSIEDTFFVSALHQRRLGSALSLKDVCDMALLLNKYKSDFDWKYVLDESKMCRINSTVYFALYQVKFLLKIDIPEYVWKGLKVPVWKRWLIRHFIENNTFLAGQRNDNKSLYLKTHFLLYDSIWEPMEYIFNIPQEQFAKYYNLEPYSKKTGFFYNFRLLYMPFKVLKEF